MGEPVIYSNLSTSPWKPQRSVIGSGSHTGPFWEGADHQSGSLGAKDPPTPKTSLVFCEVVFTLEAGGSLAKGGTTPWVGRGLPLQDRKKHGVSCGTPRHSFELHLFRHQ